MKKMILCMCVLLTASISFAELEINPNGGPGGVSIRSIKVNNPAGVPTAEVTGWTSAAITGTASGGSGSFTLTFTAFTGWDNTAAQAAANAGTLGDYLDELTPGNIGALAAGGIGVVGGTNNQINPGQAIVITMDTADLLGELVFKKTTFSIAANASANMIVYGGNTVLEAQYNVGNADEINSSNPDRAHVLSTGDMIVYANSGTGTNNFRLENYSFDVVPEPATLAMLGLGAVGLLRKRR